MNKQEFIAAYWPLAVAATQGTNVSPAILMAQVIQEGGYNPNRPGNNFLNITGKGMVRGDTDASGRKIQQSFRTYASPQESFNDYVKLMTTSPRYAGTLGGSTAERAAALGRSGYAADPTYGAKVASIAASMPAGALDGAAPTAPGPTRYSNINDLKAALVAEFPELRQTSGYRSPSYNAKVGGAKNSQHTHGTAADFSLRGMDEATQERIVRRAVELGGRGLGYYPGSQSFHVDVRQGGEGNFWGPNYSRSSLGQTPKWFQNVAAAGIPTAGGGATQVAVAGAPSSSGPPATPAGPAPTTSADLIEQGLGLLSGNPTEPQAEVAAAPAPAAAPVTEPPPNSVTPPAPEQGSAATMMAALIDRKRQERQPVIPGFLETGIFG
jgi:uncharacterized protein YcbK (DUF882 family)